MKIIHKESLEYYECELLFEAEDETGRKYIALHDDDFDSGCQYVVVPVDKSYLTNFKAGRIDLQNLILSYGEDVWYRAEIGTNSTEISLVQQTSAMSDAAVLPEPGYYISGADISTRASRFSVETGRPAVTIKVSGTEETDAHEMPFQFVVQFFRRISENLKQLVLQMDPTANQEAHQLNMVAGPVPGSFEILLASRAQTDMFGENHIVSAFERLTAFINTDFDTEIANQEIERHNSKTLKEFQKISQAVISSGTDVMVEWSAGRSGKSGIAGMSQEKARKIADRLVTVSRLKTTTVILEGRLDAINVSSRTWTIVTDEDGKRSGKSGKDGPDLDGRTTGKRYRITCDQTVDEMADETLRPWLIANFIQELMEPAEATERGEETLEGANGDQIEFEW